MKITKKRLQEIILEEEEGNAYAICNASIAKTAGTSKRNDWTDKQLKSYEDCVKSVAKKPGINK